MHIILFHCIASCIWQCIKSSLVLSYTDDACALSGTIHEESIKDVLKESSLAKEPSMEDVATELADQAQLVEVYHPYFCICTFFSLEHSICMPICIT